MAYITIIANIIGLLHNFRWRMDIWDGLKENWSQNNVYVNKLLNFFFNFCISRNLISLQADVHALHWNRKWSWKEIFARWNKLSRKFFQQKKTHENQICEKARIDNRVSGWNEKKDFSLFFCSIYFGNLFCKPMKHKSQITSE